jgi:hypothetical protein
MADSTLEEARRCPMCTVPGKHVTTRPAGPGMPRGTKIEIYECENGRCEYGPSVHPILGQMEGERWPVQINPDGTVPPKGIRNSQAKEWDIDSKTTSRDRQQARDYMRIMEEQALRGGEEFRR